MFLVCFCTETPKSWLIRILNLILSTIILPPQAPDPKAGDSQRAVKTLQPGLAVRASSIPKAGQGVFATKAFPARTRFGPYQGKRLTDPKVAQKSGYSW